MELLNLAAPVLLAACVGAITGLTVGFLLGVRTTNDKWWNEMIRRRHALYHWEDGKVYWNEDEPKVSRDPAVNRARSLSTGIGGA